MERDSFIFYRSFYEAIMGLPKDIQLELYTAIMEYALDDKYPDDLKPVARSMFTLIKPNLDVSITRHQKRGGRPPKKKAPTKEDPTPQPYTLSFEEEVDLMRADPEWADTICKDFEIDRPELSDRLESFLRHCKETRDDRPHDSFEDARSHVRYWLSKAYAPPPQKDSSKKKSSAIPPAKKDSALPLDKDNSQITARLDEIDRQTKERARKWEEQRKNAASPDYLIRKYGYDPAKVKISQVMNPTWREANPPDSIP